MSRVEKINRNVEKMALKGVLIPQGKKNCTQAIAV